MIELGLVAWKTSQVSNTDDSAGGAVSESPDTGGPGHLTVASLSDAGRAGLMAALCVGVVAAAFEMYSINAIMLKVAQEFDDMSHYAWGFTMFIIGQVFSIIVSGRLIDRFGAFKPLAAGVAVFALGLALAGGSTQMTTFLAARVVLGLGAGAMNIAVMVVIAEVYPAQRRSMMMTIFSFCYLGPAFIGSPLAAWVAATIGWRWAFWMIIPLLVIAAAVGVAPIRRLYRQRETRGGTPDDAPLWAAIAGTGGMALLQAAGQAIQQLHHVSDLNWQTVVLGVGGMIAVGAALHKLMPGRFWTFGEGMASLMWARLTLAGAFFASYSFLVPMLTEARGVGYQRAAWAVAVGAIGWAGGTVLQSQPNLKLRRDQLVTIGASCLAISIFSMAATAAWHVVPIAVGLGALLVAGFGMGLGSASTSLVVMTLSPPDAIGRNTSSLQVADNLGSAFFASVAGIIMPALLPKVLAPATFGWMYTVNGVVAVLSIGLSLRLGRVRNESSGYV